MEKRKTLLQKVGLNGLLYLKTCIRNDLSMLNGSGFDLWRLQSVSKDKFQ